MAATDGFHRHDRFPALVPRQKVIASFCQRQETRVGDAGEGTAAIAVVGAILKGGASILDDGRGKTTPAKQAPRGQGYVQGVEAEAEVVYPREEREVGAAAGTTVHWGRPPGKVSSALGACSGAELSTNARLREPFR